jgi:hypothetical protein
MAQNVSVAGNRLVIDDGTNVLSLDKVANVTYGGSSIRFLGGKGNLKSIPYSDLGTVGGAAKAGTIAGAVAQILALLDPQYAVTAAASTNGANIKASPAKVLSITAFNVSGAAKFIKLYNKATAPTVGTDAPLLTIPVPASGNVNIVNPVGIKFTTGLSIAITGAAADTDTTALTADDVRLVINYI